MTGQCSVVGLGWSCSSLVGCLVAASIRTVQMTIATIAKTSCRVDEVLVHVIASSSIVKVVYRISIVE